MEHFDFVALGGGNAGLTAGHRVAAAGKKVALIDPTPIGGLCALHGCNPKKVLVRATEVWQEVKDAGEHGVHFSGLQMDWNAVIERKHRFTDTITAETEQGLKEAGIDYIKGPARFIAENKVQVAERVINFDGALIATGSTPRKLDFAGAHHVSTSDEILELRTIPRSLVIVGSGVVALEFAQVFARLGSNVHILMHGQKVLQNMEQDLVHHLVEHSAQLGIQFHESAEIEKIERNGDVYRVFLRSAEILDGDFVLNASGRVPNIDMLDLASANVLHDKHGIKVNAYLRSVNNPKIFAAGDAHGFLELSPVASYEGDIVAENFLQPDTIQTDYSAIPKAVFTVPPLASVGLTEDEAKDKSLAVTVLKEDMRAYKVFAIAGAAPSYAKILVDANSKILGAHLYAPGADNTIHGFAMAMRYGLTTQDLAQMVYVYPSYTSAFGTLVSKML